MPDAFPWRWTGAGALALLLLACIGADLAYDLLAGSRPSHLLAELVASAVLLGGIALVRHRLHVERARNRTLARRLDELRDQEQRRDEELLRVGADAQALARRAFEDWGLTRAERDIGLLLLQGLRHKEIAHARRTSERTVRQQALNVYRKAGVEGRSELAAYFLDRILRPAAERSPREAGRA